MVDAVNSNTVLANLSAATTIADLNTILPALTGVIATDGAYQNYITNVAGAFSSPATQAEVQAMVDALDSNDVVDPNGNIWMDRNLGATQVASSSTDADAYGDLYQWGRAADGHESTTSGTTSTTSATDAPGHADFITGSSDWRTTQNDNLWQGVNGVNNPCPTGYRVPTEAEITGLGITNTATAYSSPLKLPLAGYRNSINSLLANLGVFGYYWSSTVSNASTSFFYFRSTSTSFNSSTRNFGFTVRCIKD